jgi:hypothetical protein
MSKLTGNPPGNPNWKPGVSGNPKGRGLTNRQKIAEKLISDIADKWETHGAAVLEHLATNEPAKFAAIAFGLVPKDVFLSVAQQAPGNLSPEEWGHVRGVLNAIESARLGDVPAAEIFGYLENALREFPKPALLIEHEPIGIPPPPC